MNTTVVDNLLGMGYDAVTVSQESVYSYLRERFSVQVKEPEHTFNIPLPTLDQAAQDAIRQVQFDGALKGGLFGAGGIATIPMDVLALVQASVQLSQRIAITYGFGVRTEEEKAAVWTVLGEASGVDKPEKSVSQLLLDCMPNVLQTSPYHRTLMFKLVKEIILQLVWKEGQQGLRRLFPFAGTIIGAMSNYRFLAGVGAVAKKHYRGVHLTKREARDLEANQDVARMEEEGNDNPLVQEQMHEDSREHTPEGEHKAD